jgi:DNA-binding NarL/FixJ family response regulator
VTIRVLLADDQSLVRAGFRLLLESDDEVEVVGEATNGSEALELCEQTHPHVVLMDIRMPVMDGLEATRRIVAQPALSAVRVLILTTFDHDEYVYEALRVGASGFVVKDIDPVDLLRAIKVVALGDALLSPAVTRTLIEAFVRQAPVPARQGDEQLAVLTDREREVMALVAAGLNNDEIARALYVSPATAKTHVTRAMTKLNARDRAQLVVLAYECGLVAPGHAPPRA